MDRPGTGLASHQTSMSGKQQKKSRRSGIDVDPDLKSSETESTRVTSQKSSRLATARAQAKSVTSASRAGPASQTPMPSSRIAGRYSTPVSRTQGARFTGSSVTGRSGKPSYIDIDDIDDSSPEKPKQGRPTITRQAPKTTKNAARPREAVRPAVAKLERRSSSPSDLPKVAYRNRIHDLMDVDEDSIHSSSPPEHVSDSVDGGSPERGVDQGDADMTDDDPVTMHVDQKMAGTDEDDRSDDSEERQRTADLVSRRLKTLHAQTKEANTQDRPQFLKPPKFTFKTDRPREGPQFLPAPAFIFNAPKPPTAETPNPRKYIFKEDVHLRAVSPQPVPEPELDKRKRHRRPALSCVPGALTKTLADRLIEVSQTVPERLLKKGIDEVLLEASMIQRIGTTKNKFYLVRGYLDKNGRVVCVMLPGSGPQISPSGETFPAKSTEIVPGETVGVKGLRWVIELEGVKWIVAPDWFVVREKPEAIKRNVFRNGIAEAYDVYE
ncbi:hypothetical protein DL546_006885 [Coniochaeta pulveracea]|uniref:Uncharacterized protein n=1 Tax=Coniochaeta pulveracea TaxID=177199 RepID=A0A420YNI4_9PEZI|nr:hypothetical protein DL546_006885 [Coniochaeta pulveracea]